MNGKAQTVKTTFSRETSVSIDIKSTPNVIWSLLTNAADFPRWNSTIISIEGEIKPNETIKLKSKLDEKRVFKLKIKEFEPEKKLVWGDFQGERTFLMHKRGNGIVSFEMNEKIGGILFPLFAGFIPSFDESFEQFAADLKKEAESQS